MTKRAVLYARVSGDDRGKDGRNLKSQLEMCREYALEQGYTIANELAEDDRGASGASFDLPELNRALEMARADEFEVLVVRELDRFARGLAKQLVIEQQFKQAGVDIEYTLGEYADTPEGQLNKQIRAVIAEYERVKIVERMVRGRRNKVKAGKVMANGRAPYGYRISEDRNALVVYEPEAEIVRLIFLWYVEGDGDHQPMTISGVSRKLSDMRVPTYADVGVYRCGKKKKEHGNWARSSVSRMLKNETYAGVWHFGKATQKDGKLIRNPEDHLLAVDVPTIVDRGLWEAAQKRLEENRRNYGRKARHEYLLSRRVTCGKCGCKMRGNVAGGVRLYYLCPSTVNIDYTRACNAPSFKASHVDTAVWNWAKSFLCSPEMLEEGLEAYQAERERENAPLHERLKVVDGLLTDNQAQLERLVDLYLSGSFPKETLIDRKNRLETTVSALQKEREILAAQVEGRTLTREQMQSLQDFAVEVAKGVDAAEDSFEDKRRIIETLDIQVTLVIENGQKIAYARCILGSDQLIIVQKHQCTWQATNDGSRVDWCVDLHWFLLYTGS